MTWSRAWAATAVVCSALFLLGLDFTVLNVAIPWLRQDLGPSLAQTQWIVEGYALTLGGCVLPASAGSGRYGRRRAFVTGLAVCTAASVVGALADGTTQVVAAWIACAATLAGGAIAWLRLHGRAALPASDGRSHLYEPSGRLVRGPTTEMTATPLPPPVRLMKAPRTPPPDQGDHPCLPYPP
ncbi:MFS transporter [Kitasatospora sp. NBC_00240]|uniref:MFS transporter n=1 Tax=Kitasatospora sp. NBC_00240 TaxID=2903567 RepID=UPI002256AE2A|nr:MFS transporter [Kitasatospora sp. NBC_00240]MCX5215525.1 MFS transporter [Kitasatospora sp. NBC_00240]